MVPILVLVIDCRYRNDECSNGPKPLLAHFLAKHDVAVNFVAYCCRKLWFPICLHLFSLFLPSAPVL